MKVVIKLVTPLCLLTTVMGCDAIPLAHHTGCPVNTRKLMNGTPSLEKQQTPAGLLKRLKFCPSAEGLQQRNGSNKRAGSKDSIFKKMPYALNLIRRFIELD